MNGRQSRRRIATIFFCVLLTGCDNSETTSAPALKPLPKPVETQSGYHYQSAAEQKLQDDTFANPGYLWVDEGELLFQSSGTSGQAPACASCHDNQSKSGQSHNWTTAATRYPTYDNATDSVINLEARINQCRVNHQQQTAYAWESRELLALTTYVAHQAKGQSIKAATTAPDLASSKRGAAYYQQRKGQLNLACRHCHQLNAGKMLRGDRLSQGLPTGYPAYKLEWQTLGSLQRRLRDCDAGVRAERWDYGAQIYVDVERYLKDRAVGLVIETPAVRR